VRAAEVVLKISPHTVVRDHARRPPLPPDPESRSSGPGRP